VATKTVAAKTETVADEDDDAGGKSEKTVYRVKRGDTLFSIARAFDTTIDAIKNLNRLRGNQITPGARLTILDNRNTRAAQ
jgi:LysM repeat protein